MPFAKGQSGNPGGRPKRGRSLTDLLRKTLNATGEDGVTHKQAIIDAQIARARAGNGEAIAWIFDRVDGPIAKPVESGAGAGALLGVSFTLRIDRGDDIDALDPLYETEALPAPGIRALQ